MDLEIGQKDPCGRHEREVTVAIHQPNFLPWTGYFYKIVKADIFVILDNVQFSKNSFINRNKIKTPNGSQWLTIPVLTKGKIGQLISEVLINNAIDWRKLHLKTVTYNYSKAPFFKGTYGMLEEVYLQGEWGKLADFNIALIKRLLGVLEINTEVVLERDLGIGGRGTELLINIIKKLGGNVYLSGFGGVKYQEESLFKDNGIELKCYDFKRPVYKQLWGNFVPDLSVVDYLFNCGPKSFVDLVKK